jgi:hypothetical protein
LAMGDAAIVAGGDAQNLRFWLHTSPFASGEGGSSKHPSVTSLGVIPSSEACSCADRDPSEALTPHVARKLRSVAGIPAQCPSVEGLTPLAGPRARAETF